MTDSCYPKWKTQVDALTTYQTDLDVANQLVSEWGLIAKSIARQCKWRPQGKCFLHCLGTAVCNLDGLTLVDDRGEPVGSQP